MSVACRGMAEGSKTREENPMGLEVRERRRPGKTLPAPGASLHCLDMGNLLCGEGSDSD